MPAVTPRLAVVAAVGAFLALVSPFPGWWVLAAWNTVLLAAAAGDWFAAPRVHRLRIERDLPAALTLGAAADVTWLVRNPTGRRLRVQLADELPGSLAPSRRARLVIPPRARARAAIRIRPRRRGRFSPQAVTVRIEGPLGLAARQGTQRLPGVLRVYPPFHSRAEAELRVVRAQYLQAGLRRTRGRGAGTEFDSLREYTVDDEVRQIDWAATARMIRPIVRTYRAERNQTVLVLLDSGRTMAARVSGWVPGEEPPTGAGEPTGEEPPTGAGEPTGMPRLEHAFDAAMTVTRLATALGDHTGLVAFADRVRAVVPPSNRRAQLRDVTEALYDLEALLVESNYHRAFANTLARFRRRALLVVLTELASEAVSQTLLPALPLLARHHLVLIGAVRDPTVERWAGGRPETAEATYRQAAAIRAVDQRRETARLLRRMGAGVIDAAPGRLAPELADAYLDIKATGRL